LRFYFRRWVCEPQVPSGFGMQNFLVHLKDFLAVSCVLASTSAIVGEISFAGSLKRCFGIFSF
jgi:hypothetical protein